MTEIPLLLASAVGLVLFIFFVLRLLQGVYTGKGFVIGILISLLLLLSPLVYAVVTYVQGLLGIAYSYVAIFYGAIIVLFVLVAGLFLMINNIRRTMIGIWQEIALLRNEVEGKENKKR